MSLVFVDDEQMAIVHGAKVDVTWFRPSIMNRSVIACAGIG